ncbi:helicase-related protein [Rhodococcoides kroppenstedtii]|uniref:helicase-related protein n=1 Tax=Rhodococcoides kroppenstedtii TaxID=293050 RepID=UPI0027E36FC3|nr:helicase-related protein [Rhodococcus kroppenstedtii]MBT1192047.1 DEAD/DEAH box helicase [Rhodococcus kroppenstedtii]
MTASVDGSTTPFTAAPGSIVEVRDEEWLVTRVEPASDGFIVDAIGLSELVRDTSARFATGLDDIVEVAPTDVTVVADTSEKFRRSRVWLDAMVRKTPVPISEPALTTAHRGVARPLAYQHKAVRQALNPDKLRPRILLADAVGLGKTLEIGMILSELARRGRGDRILVVTPKHVLEQMQMELWTRFALPFVRLDSAGIQRIRQILPATRNPFTYYKRVIISIDTLKSDRYLEHLRSQDWDAVVIDESHNVTNTAAQNNRLARLLASRTDALILASATPHNGRAESFAELVRMLDPSAVSPTGELDLTQVEKLVIRRHRHHPDVAAEVGSDWAERMKPRNITVPATREENAVAQELEDVWLWPGEGGSPSSNRSRLFPWVLAKAFLSSPEAFRQSVGQRRRNVDPTDPSAAREASALDSLLALTDNHTVRTSSKYQALLEHLREIGVSASASTRVVVFAERVATLNALEAALAVDLSMTTSNGDDIGQVAVLHGGLSDVDQQRIVGEFKLASSPVRVLVTGDVASEGVNLHSQCHHLVHFDIPWSLIRIEQRNGRIDRFGQRERPQIVTLLLTPSTPHFAGDLRVLTRLVEREHEAHRALGESSSLMGRYDVKAEEAEIRRVLAGEIALEDAVKSVDAVAQGGGIDGLLAQLAAGAGRTDPSSATRPDEATDGTSGLFDRDVDFLSSALEQVLSTPGKPPPNGVSWDMQSVTVASLVPPTDLTQRLRVLPQSYLRARRVDERFRLALTAAKAEDELLAARSGTSTSDWPEAHYLAPLHPVLEWAADRVLAELGRRSIYAVRGDVPRVTVVVQSTLTNNRGQVVGASWYTVGFGDTTMLDAAMTAPHPTFSDVVAAIGLSQINAGDLGDVSVLQPVVAAAVRAADAAAELQSQAIRDDTRARVDEWVTRMDDWEAERRGVRTVGDLVARTTAVSREKETALSMNPDRRLVRPLLVVLPNVDGTPA